MKAAQQNFNIQKVVAIVAVVLFTLKITAWYMTNSVAILTDALESIVNIVSGFIGLYSLYLSAKPRDANHPYGHGKVEFVSAAIEGIFIFSAGLIIIYEAINNIRHPNTIGSLDFGILLITITAIINYAVGFVAISKGKKNNSLALIASGKHLQSDTYTTLGIIIGLVLIYFTNIVLLDSIVAFIFSLLLLHTGYKIIRSSLAGIMDEADKELLNEIVNHLNELRNENWIDLHNLRIIKYGSILHLDCHLTVPWYINVQEAHKEVDILDKLINEKYRNSVELFVHTDGCLDYSCKLCSKKDCKVRKNEFIKKIDWTIDNMSSDNRHMI